jgi:ribonucleoside-diphosphate reductase alpha chain
VELTSNARRLLKARYCTGEEHPEDVFKRVAKEIGSVENREKEYLEMMESLDFLPNSPCLMNAGYSNQLKACYVLQVPDSMDGILNALKNAGLIFKEGGGVGYNFSSLREKGAPLRVGGTSSGALSFMRIFNSLVESVKQGGRRRGASMGILDYDHPEILEFIKMKLVNGVMTNFNISVMVDDVFMHKINTEEDIYLRSRTDRRIITGKIKARDMFDIICYSAWLSGDPGMLFYDRINKDNIDKKNPIIACNPCGEQFLHSDESCCLGSINLSHCVTKEGDLDKPKFQRLVKLGSQFLLDVNKKAVFPVEGCYKAQFRYNRIGLGIMGFADMLIKMKILYDSKEALKVIDDIGEMLKTGAKAIAPASASTLSIAPTGSLSIMANCSPSIEPIWSRGDYTRTLTEDIGVIKESCVSEYLRTAHEVSPEWHLKIQAQWAKWVDCGVSKTINLPHDASIGDIKNIYYKAWEWGVKGVTVFRDGCKNGDQVFSTQQKSVYGKCEGETCAL